MQVQRFIPRTARPAFTLMELMVSVAILLAVLALIGTIFATTSKAGGNATAVTTVYRQLRQAAEIIRQDLERMQPHNDVLGIAGAQPLARGIDTTVQPNRKSESATGRHRADLLMLTTRRDSRPTAFELGALNPDDYFGQTMQTVYGHADLRSYINTGPIRRVENVPLSDIPAHNWQLARRSVFFPSLPIGAGRTDVAYLRLTEPAILTGVADVFASPLDPDTLVKGFLRYNAGQLVYAYIADGAAARVLSGATQLYYNGSYWYRPGGPTGWERSEAPSNTALLPTPPFFFDFATVAALPQSWFYDVASADRRTVIDTNPPRGLHQVTAAAFLPNCSEFRVEYTYDDPREVGSPTVQDTPPGFPEIYGRDPLENIASPNVMNDWVRPVRWQRAAPGEQLMWSRLSVDQNAGDRTDPHGWPRAIRITLRAWDPGGRLTEPVTYSLIHTWPSGN